MECRTIPWCCLPFAKALLGQTRFHPHRDSGHFGNMPCSLHCTHQRRIQDFICLNALPQDFLAGGNGLLMSIFGQLDVCCTTDFVFHVPDSLPVAYKVNMSHCVFLYRLSCHHIRSEQCGSQCAAQLCLVTDYQLCTQLFLQCPNQTLIFGDTAGHHIFVLAAHTLGQ